MLMHMRTDACAHRAAPRRTAPRSTAPCRATPHRTAPHRRTAAPHRRTAAHAHIRTSAPHMLHLVGASVGAAVGAALGSAVPQTPDPLPLVFPAGQAKQRDPPARGANFPAKWHGNRDLN
jgi:hypothetical protein